MRTGFTRTLAVVAVLAAAILAGGASSAGALPATGCSYDLVDQPFLPWLDPAYYVLAPDGAAEAKRTQWKLKGGAKVVDGNERYFVHSPSDTRSLFLPSGSSALTKPMCVGVEEPTLRLFVANSGSLLSTLRVEVVYVDLLGLVQSAPIATLAATSTWQPTLPLAILANVTSLQLAGDGTTAVAFRFTPVGSSSGWRLDDVYVDPFKGS